MGKSFEECGDIYLTFEAQITFKSKAGLQLLLIIHVSSVLCLPPAVKYLRKWKMNIIISNWGLLFVFRDRWDQDFYFKRLLNLGYIYTMPHYYEGTIYIYFSVPLKFYSRKGWNQWWYILEQVKYRYSIDRDNFIPIISPFSTFLPSARMNSEPVLCCAVRIQRWKHYNFMPSMSWLLTLYGHSGGLRLI